MSGMGDPNSDRPASRAYHVSTAPPTSPRPQPSVVAARGSRSSLRQDQIPEHYPVAHSPPHSLDETGGVPLVPDGGGLPVQPSPPPPFSPIFTLIASTSQATNKQTIHHPTVHYIFADDDPEILTAALAHHHGSAQHEEGDDHNETQGSGTRTPPDRGVLLDVEPTADGSGYEVVWASSLTPDWAATSARFSRTEAGTGADGFAAGALGSSLVLKIEGVSLEPSSQRPLLGKAAAASPETDMQSEGTVSGKQQGAPTAEEYPELLREFERRMGTLRRVVEAGAARQRALEHGSVQAPGTGGGEGAAAMPEGP
ncbi:hypothetical protein VTJ83DRAFT_3032 [Remersonia thermophila]|uniref:Uncharacterized protein n=1 Tax=Remersonia thermophila TaxID=72144 RepID=A0ABR4DCX4_9PEZI